MDIALYEALKQYETTLTEEEYRKQLVGYDDWKRKMMEEFKNDYERTQKKARWSAAITKYEKERLSAQARNCRAIAKHIKEKGFFAFKKGNMRFVSDATGWMWKTEKGWGKEEDYACFVFTDGEPTDEQLADDDYVRTKMRIGRTAGVYTECGICYEKRLHTVLECGHTVCRGCWQNIQQQADNRGDACACPFCRRAEPGAAKPKTASQQLKFAVMPKQPEWSSV